MPATVPYRVSPNLGPQLDEKFTGLPYWDSQLGVSDGSAAAGTIQPSYKLLNIETGNDGAQYIWVKANGAIAATPSTGTNVIVSANGNAATGAGNWWAPVSGVTSGQFFHARNKAWNAF